RAILLADLPVGGGEYHLCDRSSSMYKTILVTVDGTPTDRAIIEHIKQLGKIAQSRVVLLHVADGWAARTYGPDAVSPEISEDTEYLKKVQAEFQAAGISADAELAYGDPASEITPPMPRLTYGLPGK